MASEEANSLDTESIEIQSAEMHLLNCDEQGDDAGIPAMNPASRPHDDAEQTDRGVGDVKVSLENTTADHLTHSQTPPSPPVTAPDSKVETASSTQTEVALDSTVENVSSAQHEVVSGSSDALSAENHHHTDYLQRVISCLQTATESSSGLQKDHVLISRGELTLLVQQTLATQTMCNYMQQLVQENKTLKQEKQTLMRAVMEARQEHQPCQSTDRETKTSLRQCQLVEGQVFRFDKCPVPSAPFSLHHPKEQQEENKTSIASQVEMDGDSLSFQLPGQLGFDGDQPSDLQTGAEGNAASGNVPHVVGSVHGTAEVGAIHLKELNIPAPDLFEGAPCYSVGPQPVDGAAVPPTVVSKEQLDLVMEELEKTKRYVHKLLKDGGLNPDTANELAHLRTKVSELQRDNSRLIQELESRLSPDAYIKQFSKQQMVPEQQSLIDKMQKMEKHGKMKDQLIETLNKKVKALEAELREKSGMQSQPPSNVGLQALPPISVISVAASTQTEELAEKMCLENLQQELAQLVSQNKKLERDIDKIGQQLSQAREHERDQGMAMMKMQAKDRDLEQQLQDANDHRKELADEITGLNNEMDELKRKAKDSDNKRRALEEMIADERRRYSRDEEELLKRIDTVSKERDEAMPKKEALGRLLLGADTAWRDSLPYGSGVPPEYTSYLSSLRRQYSSAAQDSVSSGYRHSTARRSPIPRSAAASSSSSGQASPNGLSSHGWQYSPHGSSRSGGIPAYSGSSRSGDNMPVRMADIHGTPYSSLPQMSHHHPNYNPQLSPHMQSSRSSRHRSGGSSSSTSSSSSSSSRAARQYPR